MYIYQNVAQASLEFLILLPQSPDCQVYSHVCYTLLLPFQLIIKEFIKKKIRSSMGNCSWPIVSTNN